MEQNEDFLDEIIAERTKRNPDFPRLVEEALRKRQEIRARGEDPNDEDVATNDDQPQTQKSAVPVIPD